MLPLALLPDRRLVPGRGNGDMTASARTGAGLRRVAALATLGIAVAAALAAGGGAGGEAQHTNNLGPLDRPRIVYLPDAARPIADPREAGRPGVRVVASAAGLRAAAPAADALIVDGSRLAEVAAGGWLAEQRTEGRLLWR
jgi:hypothetical protein